MNICKPQVLQTRRSFPMSVLVLLLAVLSPVTSTLMCPSNCRCSNDANNFTVDCQNHPGVDHGQLSDQIDSLLSSSTYYGRVTSLGIVRTPLTRVPRSVCRLTTLRQLNLDENRLTQLPDDCFPRLKHLRNLTASRNQIRTLQDGLFDELQELVSVILQMNRIVRIGARVFSNESDMINLRYIDLSHNNLTSLEPWPLVRGQLGTEQSPVTIQLYHNEISTFTNEMGWKVNCSANPGFVRVDLSWNRIRHAMDIAEGWIVVKSFSELFCVFRFRQGSPGVRFSLDANSFACDCIDYPLYTMTAAFPFYDLFQNCHCNPEHSPFYYLEIPTIPLDQFVCELTERCPSGCRCLHRPANATLHVYCSNTNLTELPLELPQLPKRYTRYKLDFSDNAGLRRLERRQYFVNTSILDVSNCDIDEIPTNVWKDIAEIKRVFLDRNRLTSLPQAVAAVPLSASVSMDENPWMCSCANRWMSGWLRKTMMIRRVINANRLQCGSPKRLFGKSIITITDREFCHDPVSEERARAVTISLSVAGVVLILLSVGVIVHRLRFRLYARWNFHPFDRDECIGEDMYYDVLLSSSADDNLPDVNGIRERLEEHGYRVCYPPRDFLPGVLISENITNAVERSKRTVCFLTSHFLQRFGSLMLFYQQDAVLVLYLCV